MIPRILHIVWIGPHDPPREMMDSWSAKHVDGWRFIEHRDHKGFENQTQIDERYALGEFNGVADLMRYEILVEHGGFVVDADSTCLKALDEGPEDFLSNETAVACYEHETLRPGIIGCGFLGAPPEHPFFRACIDEAATQDSSVAAWKTVGPLLMGRVAGRMPDQIWVYPAGMFNPEHYSRAKAPGNHPIYARQGWGGTNGYNSLRKLPCRCPLCRHSVVRAPWM